MLNYLWSHQELDLEGSLHVSHFPVVEAWQEPGEGEVQVARAKGVLGRLGAVLFTNQYRSMLIF